MVTRQTNSPPVAVDLGDRSYSVHVGVGILADLGRRLAELFKPGRVFLVVDDNVPEALVDRAVNSLTGAGFKVTRTSLCADEKNKTIQTLDRLLQELAATKQERSEPVVALGGGIVGDVAGFLAATYRRGVAIVQCPTTLLAMVDASVGGKTGVNVAAGAAFRKNLAGAFWQPSIVMADVTALHSLDARQLRAGLAECVKHGLITKGVGVETDLFDWTCANIANFIALDEQALVELVRRNVRVKAEVVAGDEHEQLGPGKIGRALLNLGHTYAHAIEPIRSISPTADPADAPLLHGEAVGLGLIASAACSRAMGRLDGADQSSIKEAVTAAGLPTSVDGLPDEGALLGGMAHDKKTTDGAMRLVLPIRLGEAAIIDNPPLSAVKAGLDSIRAGR